MQALNALQRIGRIEWHLDDREARVHECVSYLHHFIGRDAAKNGDEGQSIEITLHHPTPEARPARHAMLHKPVCAEWSMMGTSSMPKICSAVT